MAYLPRPSSIQGLLTILFQLTVLLIGLPVIKHDTPLAIQQAEAVPGSKPKSNSTSKPAVKFGTWTKNTTAHIAGLAGYDAILGMPTLIDGDAVIDVRARKVAFRQWGVGAVVVDGLAPDVIAFWCIDYGNMTIDSEPADMFGVRIVD
jgi:hypothetical protein